MFTAGKYFDLTESSGLCYHSPARGERFLPPRKICAEGVSTMTGLEAIALMDLMVSLLQYSAAVVFGVLNIVILLITLFRHHK